MAKTKVRIPRTQVIAFYVSDEERTAVIAAAQKEDMSISDYCRKTLMKIIREEVQ